MSKLYSQLNDLTSQIENLERENEKLISNINLHLAQHFELSNENKKLKQQITELKTKLYDATVKEQRLLKILKETSY